MSESVENFVRINAPRVEKIIKMIETIETSSRSNKIEPQELASLLAPVVSRIRPQGAESDQPAAKDVAPPEPVRQSRTRVPQWATVRDMAEKADLDDLHAAMLIYLSRVDEELHSSRSDKTGK